MGSELRFGRYRIGCINYFSDMTKEFVKFQMVHPFLINLFRSDGARVDHVAFGTSMTKFDTP